MLAPWKATTNLDNILKSRDIALPTKVHIVKAIVFPVVMYGCESWTIKKAEHWRTDAFELCCWRRHCFNRKHLAENNLSTHSSTLAGKIPWTEDPGGLQSMASWRVGHCWATSLSLFTFHFHALEKEMATHSSVLAWRIPGKAEPGGLPSLGSHRVGHDWSDLAAAAATCFLIFYDGIFQTCTKVDGVV